MEDSRYLLYQHKEMRDLYTFVLQKFFEIIPIDKQYGITQWCATDSPKDSGWRPGLDVYKRQY